MATGTTRSSVTSRVNRENIGARYNSSCHGCTQMKSEVQVLEDEIKSMSEIINILREDLKNNCAYREDCNRNNAEVDILKSTTFQCRNCVQLESELHVVLNELSSVKLITKLLSEECKIKD